jgi:tRNA threonylcarbamoyladenosine biosynthesis protein TsaB
MALILNIESATTMCSVALAKDALCIDSQEIDEGYSHAENLAVFVDEILKRNNLKVTDLNAIAISEGPGSYTGLRIGVSLEKGLCYGGNVKLIAVSTLQQMCMHPDVVKELNFRKDGLLCPMLDARRMEVYTSVYDVGLKVLLEPTNLILDETSYESFLAEEPVIFFGNGSDKFQDVTKSESAYFVKNVTPSAIQMVGLSELKYQASQFEDVAYFEPFYLKEFQATTPKKLV